MRMSLHIFSASILLSMATGALAFGQELPAGALLVGQWDFDEGEGLWVEDSTRFAHGGYLGGSVDADEDDPTWAGEGHDGGCLRFDGVGDSVCVPHGAPMGPVEGIIVEAWIKQSARTKFGRVVDKGLTFDLYVHDNGQASFRLLGAEAHGVRSPKPVPLDEWVSLRGEVYGGKMRLLVNGEVVAERAYTEAVTDSHHDLYIGSASLGRPFAGLIDEVKLWNVGWEPPPAMQAAEPDEDTIGLWHLEDLQATDASGRQTAAEVVNAQVVEGKIGKALRFNGDGWVRVADNATLDISEELCIDAWVFQRERSPYARVVEKSDWTWGVWITRTGVVDFFFKTTDGDWHHVVTMDDVPLRQWTHLRAEFDGFEAVVYINGNESVRSRMGPGQDRRGARIQPPAHGTPATGGAG